MSSKITADGDCSHEIKRFLLLGRKAMINLDSILKSRDKSIANKGLSTQSRGSPVVMYGCESWTIKKAERGSPKMVEESDGETTFSPTNSSKDHLNAEQIPQNNF